MLDPGWTLRLDLGWTPWSNLGWTPLIELPLFFNRIQARVVWSCQNMHMYILKLSHATEHCIGSQPIGGKCAPNEGQEIQCTDTEMMSNTFYILNNRYRSEGTKTRNKWKLPLTKIDDWRFEIGKKSYYDHKRVFKLPAYIIWIRRNNSARDMLLKQCISLADIKTRNNFRLWSGGIAYVKKDEISVADNIRISGQWQKKLHRTLMGSMCDKIYWSELFLVLVC